jgi:hypothetical protein
VILVSLDEFDPDCDDQLMVLILSDEMIAIVIVISD